MRSIGIVGAAGSGKSTLAALLADGGYTRRALADPLKVQLGFMAHIQLRITPPTRSFDIEPYENGALALFEAVRNIMYGRMGYEPGAFMRNEPEFSDTVRARDIKVRDYFVRYVNERKPHFRKALQYYGTETIRDLATTLGHADVPWVRVLLSEAERDRERGLPTVCDDVRFKDEVDGLHDHDFLIVRIVRPGQQVAAPAHASEEQWRTLPVDIEIVNNHSYEELSLLAEELLKEAA